MSVHNLFVEILENSYHLQSFGTEALLLFLFVLDIQLYKLANIDTNNLSSKFAKPYKSMQLRR